MTDIGKASLTVCLRTPAGPGGGRRVSETRTFKTTTRSLVVMRDWLVESGVTIAAMESTSTYWKAPFYCLEEVMEVWLPGAAQGGRGRRRTMSLRARAGRGRGRQAIPRTPAPPCRTAC